MNKDKSRNCLLIGDSNFINKFYFKVDNRKKNFNLGELLEFILNQYKFFNLSVSRDTLLDVYKRLILGNVLPNKNFKIIIIGLGINDSNYYYSLGKNIISHRLHFQLLDDLIDHLIKKYLNCKIILIPVHRTSLSSDSKIRLKMNEQIKMFNKMRDKVSKIRQDEVYFLNEIKIDPDIHLEQDGLHYNKEGLVYISKLLCRFINNLK